MHFCSITNRATKQYKRELSVRSLVKGSIVVSVSGVIYLSLGAVSNSWFDFQLFFLVFCELLLCYVVVVWTRNLLVRYLCNYVYEAYCIIWIPFWDVGTVNCWCISMFQPYFCHRFTEPLCIRGTDIYSHNMLWN